MLSGGELIDTVI